MQDELKTKATTIPLSSTETEQHYTSSCQGMVCKNEDHNNAKTDSKHTVSFDNIFKIPVLI